jgi:hypothetical protein
MASIAGAKELNRELHFIAMRGSRADAREYFFREVSPGLGRWRSLPTNCGKRPRNRMPRHGEKPRKDNSLQQYRLDQDCQARGMRQNGASRDIAMPGHRKTCSCPPDFSRPKQLHATVVSHSVLDALYPLAPMLGALCYLVPALRRAWG